MIENQEKQPDLARETEAEEVGSTTSGFKGFLQNLKLRYMMGLVILTLVFMVSSAFTNSSTVIGVVQFQGVTVCQVSDQTEAKALIEELLNAKAQSRGLTTGLTTDLQVSQITAEQSNVLTGEALRQVLNQDKYFSFNKAAALKMDGEVLLYMTNQLEVETLLNNFMQPYQEAGAEISLEQSLEIVDAVVSLDQISNPSQALVKLKQGKKATAAYVVQAGDTCYSLAKAHNLTLTEFTALNPGLDINQIKVGQTIQIASPAPLVNVISSLTIKETQPVEFEIETTEDSCLNYGQEKIVQEGKNGEKEVSRQVVKRNGTIIKTEVLQETVTVQPQNQIIAIGSNDGQLVRPCSGVVTSNYGSRWGRLHAGTDFGGNTGDPVYAAASGTVVKAGNFNDGYGYQVVIDHGNGVVTRYAHLSAYGVQVGQTVKVAENIAQIGSTGNSTGPHLHFETIVNGQTQNPMLLLEQVAQ